MSNRWIVDVPIKEFYTQTLTTLANDAGGLTTDIRTTNFRSGFTEVLVGNDDTSDDVLISMGPRIVAVYFYDDSAGTYTDLLGPTKAMLDSAQTGTTQFTLGATTDYLYIGTTDRVKGYRFDLDGTLINNNAQTATFQHSSSSGFTTSADTDGTESGGAMFAQDGNFVIDTVPADGTWRSGLLSSFVQGAPDVDGRAYWGRISAGGALDAVEIEQLSAIHHDPWAANSANPAGYHFHLKKDTEKTFDLTDSRNGSLNWIANSTTATPAFKVTWLRK